MAASDAKPVPRKNAAYRFYFAIRKPSDSTLITTWTGQDSEVSLDGAAFADCTNEATEIGTSGAGYIDLTASEMNADAVLLKVSVTNTGAVPLIFVLYPEEAGDYRADAVMVGGQTASAAGTVTFPGTIASTTNITAGTITTVTNLTNAPTAGDLTATMKTSIGTAVAASAVASVTGNVGGNVTGSVGSVVGNVGGNVVGSVGSVTNRVTANTDQLAGQTVTAATGVTFPTTVSSYAGGAVASVTGSVGSVVGSVGSVTAAVTVTGDTATAATRFLTMIELDGAVYRYTTNALELAPGGGGDGSTLTAIPWNAAWDAEVQSEVADALTAYGASTYGGADTAGTTTLLNRLTATRSGYLDNLATAPLTSLGATAPAGWINTAAFAAGTTVPRVTLVDTTTQNTDMRGTDNAALAATALSSATWTNTRAGYLDNLSAGTVPTASQIATAWGVRDLGYGVTADEYLQGWIPKVVFSANGESATVYCADNTTELQTLTATRLQTTVGGLRTTTPTI